MEKEKFSFRKRIKSFKYAANGIVEFFTTEHNARIHLAAAIVAIGISIYFQISRIEWAFIIIAISIVLIAELFNTCIELIADYLTKERHPQIKLIKDIAAGAVLVAAIMAAVIAVIIFIPKIASSFFSNN